MIEVLKQALEALEEVQKFMNTSDWFNDRVTSLRQAIAELESQEPVAWRTFDGEGQYEYRAYEENESYADDWNKRNPNHKGWVEPLYTHPPQRKPLTNEQIDVLARTMIKGVKSVNWLARAIEAAHDIKGE